MIESIYTATKHGNVFQLTDDDDTLFMEEMHTLEEVDEGLWLLNHKYYINIVEE